MRPGDVFGRVHRLTAAEQMAFSAAGAFYTIETAGRGGSGRDGQDPGTWLGSTMEGILAEAVLAKVLGVFPTMRALGNRAEGDVGLREVKATSRAGGDLLVPARQLESPARAGSMTYWLLEGKVGAYRIVGWLRGEELRALGRLLQEGDRRPDGLVMRPGRGPTYVAAQAELHSDRLPEEDVRSPDIPFPAGCGDCRVRMEATGPEEFECPVCGGVKTFGAVT